MFARIENRDRSDHTIVGRPVDGGGEPTRIVIPAGTYVSPGNIVPGVLAVQTKADLDGITKVLGRALSDDGSTVLRLVRV